MARTVPPLATSPWRRPTRTATPTSAATITTWTTERTVGPARPLRAPMAHSSAPRRSSALVPVKGLDVVRSVGQQAAGDDLQAQRLVGALEDRQDPGVHEVAADRVLLGVAEPAVDLHGLAGHPLGRLADVRLDHGGLQRPLALGHHPGDDVA